MTTSKIARRKQQLPVRMRKVLEGLEHCQEPAPSTAVMMHLPGNWSAHGVEQALQELANKGLAKRSPGPKGTDLFEVIAEPTTDDNTSCPVAGLLEQLSEDADMLQEALEALLKTTRTLATEVESITASAAKQEHRLVAASKALQALRELEL